MSQRVWLGVALSGVLSVGCASSQAQRVNDARMAEIEAREREQLAAIDAKTTSHAEHREQAGEQTQEALEASNQAGSEARGEIAEVSAEREQYRIEASGRLEKLGVRLDAAEQKTEVLGARAPTSLRQELDTARTSQKLLKQRVTELQAVEPARWSSNKDELDRGLDTLDQRIDQLNKSIGGV